MDEKRYPSASNTGILTARAPTLDIDILDPEAAAAVEALAKERFEESGFMPVRFGLFPKRALPFRCDTPFAKIAVPLTAPDDSIGQKLEFLANGQQVVINGIHPDTGRPYDRFGDSPGDIARADLAYIHLEEAQALIDDAVALVVGDFGYRRPRQTRAKINGSGGSETGPTDWVVNFADHDADAAMAMKLLRAGMDDGAVVNFLHENVQALTDIDTDRKAWRLTEIPGMVSSARAKIDAEKQEDAPPIGETVGAVDLWPNANPPVLPEGLLPERIETFARAAAKVGGADESGFALAALAVSAAAIRNSIQLRPMQHCPWTESARIWVALVGDPSARKSAILAAAAAQLKREDRRRYQEFLREKAFFDSLLKEDQKTARKPAPVRTHPQRHLGRGRAGDLQVVDRRRPRTPRRAQRMVRGNGPLRPKRLRDGRPKLLASDL